MNFNINDISNETFQAVKEAYDDGDRVFNFTIDSYGGSLDAALGIYDLMRSDADNVVTCSVEGHCISAATVILCSAPVSNRTATKNSSFLIHSPLMSVVQDVNKSAAESILSDLSQAYNQLKSIYLERTSIGDLSDDYMSKEKTFYSDEALRLGFIGGIKELYNRKQINNFIDISNSNPIMKLKKLLINILNQLKNEVYKTKDGREFEAVSLEVGVPVDGLEDGVYELEDGTVITVEQGLIVDLVEPEKEESPIANEDEKPADDNSDKGEVPADVEKAAEEAAAAVQEAADKVAEEAAAAESEEEVKEIVEEAIKQVGEEIVNRYKPFIELIRSCGGVKRLQALKNAAPKKDFSDNSKARTQKKSLEDLLSLVRK